MGGKGIIDIIIAVPDSTEISNYIEIMESGGYEFRPSASTNSRLFLRKDYLHGGENRRIHLHLTQICSQDYNEVIRFRNILRNNPKIKAKYSQLKKQALLQAKGNGAIYKKFKEEFII